MGKRLRGFEKGNKAQCVDRAGSLVYFCIITKPHTYMKDNVKTIIAAALMSVSAQGINAQGWPGDYDGVMLQGFYWDSYTETAWATLEKQADELSQYFSLIWIPQSGNCNTSSNSMGYMPVYYFDQNSSFGSESQLRSMISAFKELGTGVIADVVINHRNVLGENSSRVDFPEETYNGVTYQMLSTDICADDDGGDTYSWASSNGVSLSSAEDTGEDWVGCRDLDHTNDNVQTCVLAYLDYLLNDIGYSGFRYDMTKGYSATYTGLYNSSSNPTYSVGEYWDGNTSTLKDWVDGTAVDGVIQSAAFDFPFRYSVRDAINNGDWTELADAGLSGEDGGYSRYAVTFVENHDTEYRSSSEPQDPIYSDTLAANAFLLAMPGTPCVFLTHWDAYKQEIKAMIDARKAAGITNESKVTTYSSTANYIANSVKGNNGYLMAVVGPNASKYSAASSYIKILEGYHYCYYLLSSAEVAWADRASGEYSDAFDVTLTAVSADESVQLAYTLDGTDPTAGSSVVESGTKITIGEDCTLKVGLLINGTVSGIATRIYTIEPFEAHTATVYLKDPEWSTPVYFYAWDDSGAELNGSWPGTVITATTVIDGITWYYQTFDINEEDYTFNIIFDQGSGLMQTVDIGPISEDTFYEIGDISSGKYTVNDVTSEHTSGISGVIAVKGQAECVRVYSTDGRMLRSLPVGTSMSEAVSGLRSGIYIVNGKKIII